MLKSKRSDQDSNPAVARAAQAHLQQLAPLVLVCVDDVKHALLARGRGGRSQLGSDAGQLQQRAVALPQGLWGGWVGRGEEGACVRAGYCVERLRAGRPGAVYRSANPVLKRARAGRGCREGRARGGPPQEGAAPA